jgi:hypothetical protein
MTTKELAQHFKTRTEIAEVAKVTRQAVAQWFKMGLVPRRSAELLEAHIKARRRK